VYHLIYTSQALHEFSAADLKKLLVRSRLNNSAVNVTGMLIYRGGVFLQALEGDEPSVREVFSRIEADTRHSHVQILTNQPSVSGQRLFGKWSMGFANAASNAQVLNGFINLAAGQNLLALTEKQAIDVLSAYGGNEQSAAA
jgi:Sensors of blue-light using FAD